MKKYVVGRPMERVAIDIMGPLPETPRGNKYIVVISDYFTRWVEAHPTVNQEAITIANLLMKEVISRFGLMSILHSDQGRQFESTLISQLCAYLDIHKTRTVAFRPQSDGLVERFNKTLQDIICPL